PALHTNHGFRSRRMVRSAGNRSYYELRRTAAMRRKQLIRGNTAFNDSYIGNAGEITVDLQTKEMRLHDGSTPGGVVIPNTATIPGLSRKILLSIDSIAAPGNPVAADSDNLLTLAAAGTY